KAKSMTLKIAPYLQLLIKQKGSDLHLAAQSHPMIRVHGSLMKIDVPALAAQDVEAILSECLTDVQRKYLKEHKSVDFALCLTGVGTFRANIFLQRFGLSAVFRALADTPPTIEDLRLPSICRTAASYPTGLVLVTGP